MEINLAKLKKRYPEKCCVDQAYTRDLLAERAVLENAANKSE